MEALGKTKTSSVGEYKPSQPSEDLKELIATLEETGKSKLTILALRGIVAKVEKLEEAASHD